MSGFCVYKNMSKVCSKCGEEKELSEFHNRKESKDGFRNECKKCRLKVESDRHLKNRDKNNERSRLHYKNNREERLRKQQEYYKRNKHHILAREKQYRADNIEKFKEKDKEYHYKNRDKRIKHSKNYYKENKITLLKQAKEYYKEHSDDRKQYNKYHRLIKGKEINKRNSERRKNNLHLRLSNVVSSSIRHRLKRRLSNKGGKSTWSFLPYIVDDLIRHLESLFEPWMNWNNYGNKDGCWSIDHIRPDSSFDYKSVEDKEFQKCWALENLRPLSHVENVRKGKKIL